MNPAFISRHWNSASLGFAVWLMVAGLTNSLAASPPLEQHETVLGSLSSPIKIVQTPQGPMNFVDSNVIEILSETSNGCRLATSVANNSPNPTYQVVLDGKIMPGFADVIPQSLTFSMDGKHFAFIAKKDGKQTAIVDGKPGPLFDSIAFPTVSMQVGTDLIRLFSSDGEHTAYMAQNGAKWQVMTDGKPGPEFDQIDQLELVMDFDPLFSKTIKTRIDPLIWGGSYQEPLWSPLIFEATGPIFSPDSKHVAYRGIHKVGNKSASEQVVLDGVPGPLFAGISEMRISPDGGHLIYLGFKENRHQVIVIDGTPDPEVGQLDGQLENAIVFCPDGSSLAYKADGIDGKEHIVVAGKIGPDSDEDVTDLAYSSDGKHVAYTRAKFNQNNEQEWVMMDGAPVPDIDGMSVKEFKFSSQGGHVAYFARNDHQQKFVVDGQSRPADGSLEWFFSPDGQRLAYITSIHGRNKQMILDGVFGPEVDNINPYSVKFSPESGHLTYVASPLGNPKKDIVVVDQIVGPEFDAVFQTFPIFSLDGKHFAYVAKKGALLQVVVDGKPGPDLYNVDLDSVQFSPDGERLFYIALMGYQQTVVVNTTPGPMFDEIRKGSLGFSADGKHYAYVAKGEDNKWRAAIDGVAGPVFNQIGPKNVIFSSDSQHWAYVAQNGGGQEVMVDGRPGPQFGNIAVGPIECKDGHLEYLAFEPSGDKTNLVRVTVPGFGPAKP